MNTDNTDAIKVGDILDTGFGWRLRVEQICMQTLEAGTFYEGIIYLGKRWNAQYGEKNARPGCARPSDVESVGR